MNIYDLFAPKRHAAVPGLGVPHAAGGNGYAGAALDRECDAVRRAVEGTRNHTLNVAAFNLGQLVAAGHLDELTVKDALTEAAQAAGLELRETLNTIDSGMTSGADHPRIVPEREADPLGIVHVLNGGMSSDAAQSSPELGRAAHEPERDDDTSDPAAARQVAIFDWVHEALPLLDWETLWDDDEDEEWILEPLIPARRMIALYSPPKVGKSLLVLELAAAIATGRDVLGATPDRPRKVLYVDFENDPRGDIRPRLQAMGYTPQDLKNLAYLSFPRLAALDDERGAQELLAAVTVYGAELVVIDTVSRAVGGEENENDTWLRFYRHTGLRLKQAGVACVRLDHTGKDVEKGQRGGSAKAGDADAIWRMQHVSGNTYSLTCEAHRLPIPQTVLTFERMELPHLHSSLKGGSREAWEAKVEEIVTALDSTGLDVDAGRDKARAALRTTGVQARDTALSAAVKRRKNRASLVELRERYEVSDD